MSADLLEVTIEQLVAGGAGRAVHDGMQLFVPFVAPGERVRVRVVQRHRNYLEAEVVKILAPGPDRVIPPCPVFGACGGCQWQHLRYEAQLVWKQKILAEQLQRLAKIGAPHVLPTVAAPSPWHYRSRIQLQVDAAGRVGFFRAGSHEIVEFDTCAIADARINAQLAEAKVRLRTEGRGRHVRLDAQEGFMQVNPAQNEQLRQMVADGVRVRGGGRVVELYCGSGNLTLPLAAHATQVVAADEHAGAIAQAKQLASVQQITNVDFRATAAHRLLKHLARPGDAWDGVVLDPPRRGAAEAMAGLIALRPQWIGYVSCDPATLARDVATLCAAGYRHESSQPIDMFPQTHHIESLTWLGRAA